MFKKFFSNILLFVLFLFSSISVYACWLPPDISSIYTIHPIKENESVKVTYSLFSWEPLSDSTYQRLWIQKDNLTSLKEVTSFISDTTILSINWVSSKYNYLDWKFINKNDWTWWTNLFSITFDTWYIYQWWEFNLSFKYDKSKLLDLSTLWLIHSQVIYDDQEKILWWWNDKWIYIEWKTWQIYNLNESSSEIWSFIDNNLIVTPISKEEYTQLQNKWQIDKQIWESQDFKSQLLERIKSSSSFLVIIFVFIYWWLHALLPWHSKSILTTVIMWYWQRDKLLKSISTLIASITISHTLVIFLLALIVYLLQLGVWEWSSYVILFSWIIYILFWIYFLFTWINDLKNKKDWCSDSCNHIWWEFTIKKSFISWILLGFNPCIDALLVFILALSIWGISYWILLVTIFSLWLAVTLWILSFLILKWSKFLEWRYKDQIQRYIVYVSLFFAIIIISYGIVTILSSPLLKQ